MTFNLPNEIPEITPVHVNTVLVHSNGVVLGIFATKSHKTIDTEVAPKNKKGLKPCEASEAPQQSKRSAVETALGLGGNR